ncbi:MAG: HEAT repeat domain-containing protein [Phycisphaerae bacterium]|nr:HEAT repeat domain-containing protein [Phycisphaerae bacterium]
MSQAKNIYDLMAQTHNAAADKSLLLALDMLEEPYQTAAMETLMDRGSSRGTGELVGRYHIFSQNRKSLLCKRVGDLINGLFHAADMDQGQTRLNALAIIRKTKYYRLSEIVTLLLRDPVPQISQQAGVTLLEMAHHFSQTTISDPEDLAGQPGIATSDDRGYFLSAIQNAIHRDGLRHRREVVLAAMMVVPADRATFWADSLSPYHAVGETVREIIQQNPQSELACFCLTALKNNHLRFAVSRAIAQSTNADYIIALAETFLHDQDDQMAEALQKIKKARWLAPGVIAFETLPPNQQKALTGFIGHLGLAPEAVVNYYAPLIERLGPETIAAVMNYFPRFSGERVLELLVKVLNSPYEHLAHAAFKQLIQRRPKNLSEIIARQLNGPHESLRQMARKYFQKIAFESYWNKFNAMSDPQKIKTGQAVFKIDPDATTRWTAYIQKPDPAARLEAIQMIRILGRTAHHTETLKHCLRDQDPFVRSCAIAALGDLKASLTPALAHEIALTLEDTDLRVRANAIDALSRSPSPEVLQKIVPFIHSRHSRLRANAIKTLHHLKAESTNKVIRQMLCDPRPGHRRSALWLQQHLADTVNENDSLAMERSHVEYYTVPL